MIPTITLPPARIVLLAKSSVSCSLRIARLLSMLATTCWLLSCAPWIVVSLPLTRVSRSAASIVVSACVMPCALPFAQQVAIDRRGHRGAAQRDAMADDLLDHLLALGGLVLVHRRGAPVDGQAGTARLRLVRFAIEKSPPSLGGQRPNKASSNDPTDERSRDYRCA